MQGGDSTDTSLPEDSAPPEPFFVLGYATDDSDSQWLSSLSEAERSSAFEWAASKSLPQAPNFSTSCSSDGDGSATSAGVRVDGGAGSHTEAGSGTVSGTVSVSGSGSETADGAKAEPKGPAPQPSRRWGAFRYEFSPADDDAGAGGGAYDRSYPRAVVTMPRSIAAGDAWSDADADASTGLSHASGSSNPSSTSSDAALHNVHGVPFNLDVYMQARHMSRSVFCAGESAAQRRLDRQRRAQHRQQLRRRVDASNQPALEHALRDRGRDRFTPPTPCPSGPSRSTLLSSLSADSLRVPRQRPKGHVPKVLIEDFQRRMKAEIENEAWETDYKFPDFSVGIIPQSYCLRSEYFEYDLLTQFGEIPGYPEGRGILESRESKLRRGILEEAFSRKRKHDEEYEKEMNILNDTKESRTDILLSDSTGFPGSSESQKFFRPISKVTVGVQANLDNEQKQSDINVLKNTRSNSDEGYETMSKPKIHDVNKSKKSEVIQLRKSETKNDLSSFGPIALGAKIIQCQEHHKPKLERRVELTATKPKRLPPLPGRRHVMQKLATTNSDSGLHRLLQQKNRHLPPIGERGQGDEPCKYLHHAPAKHSLPSKYPRLPPIRQARDSSSRA